MRAPDVTCTRRTGRRSSSGSRRPSPTPSAKRIGSCRSPITCTRARSAGGNRQAWLKETLAAADGSLLEQGPDEHGLTFLPFLGGERSTGWSPSARGTVHGLTFDTAPRDLRQAALEGIGFRFAAIAD